MYEIVWPICRPYKLTFESFSFSFFDFAGEGCYNGSSFPRRDLEEGCGTGLGAGTGADASSDTGSGAGNGTSGAGAE